MNIGVIGPGRVGTGLARLLADRGYTVRSVSGKTRAHAERLAAALPHCEATSPQAVADTCDLVFITVPDNAITAVAHDLNWQREQGVVHCSGALSAAALAAVAQQGAVPGAFHPLQTLPDAQAALANLPGSFIGIEAEEPLFGQLARIAESLDCTWGSVPAAARPAYHAAAVLVSNYTVALAHAGVELWQAIGKSEQEALHALLPLLQGAVHNLRRLGPTAALTGPVARGDWATVQQNLAAIDENAPQHTFVYAAMALAMIYNNLAAIDGNDGAFGKDCAVDKTALERELQALLSAALKNRGTS
ncbi:MAG: DUF2520 domain-containing protein [Chloroflexi bacterium]|nr:DUF2520 domain-containing protein [Chloroflexota bacterium]